MSSSNVLKFIKDKEAEFVDLRFTDPRGKLQHLTMDSTIIDEEMLIKNNLIILAVSFYYVFNFTICYFMQIIKTNFKNTIRMSCCCVYIFKSIQSTI